MRARTAASFALALTLAGGACGDSTTGNLPPVTAPFTPIPTFTTAAVLTSVGPTILSGAPGTTVLVQVRATTASGTPVKGVIIVFQLRTGGGSVVPMVPTTEGDGIASAKWTFGPDAGLNLLSVVGGSVAPVEFSASTAIPSADTP